MLCRIAGITFDIRSLDPLPFLEPFESAPDGGADVTVSVSRRPPPAGMAPIYEEMGLTWFDLEDGRFAFRVGSGSSSSLTAACRDWSEVTVYLGEDAEEESLLRRPVGEIIFRSAVVCRKGIVVHASAVGWQGRGLAFAAPAGMGKSTHAGLWVEHEGAVILNGDRPLITAGDEGIFVSGTPWSGSSPHRVNATLPLDMLVFLEKGKENHIRRLSVLESIQWLMPRCCLPYYNKAQMDMAMKTMNRIISAAPLYLLTCRPDAGAVEAVRRQLLFGRRVME